VSEAYAPSRSLPAKLNRRFTQWRAARPVHLRFDAPMLSVCFDDFPISAAEAGARILEDHGARGTFYAAAALANADGPCGVNFSPAHARTLAAAGHEIGCHTFEHADCAVRGAYASLHDIARNRDALAEMGCGPARTLAYPYGETRVDLKKSLPARFAGARGVLPGLNVGRADLAHLRAYPLFGAGALGAAHAALAQAARRNAWMIVFTHDVSPTPSPWGTSEIDLNDLLKAARAAGVHVAPVCDVLERRR